MTNPLRRLKYLPWRSLFQVSFFTVSIVAVIDFLLALAYLQSSPIRRALSILFAPSLGLLVSLAIAFAIGVLAVYLLERFYKQIIINANNLWALVLCLALVLFVKSLLPLPSLLIGFSYTDLVGILLGIFWKGRSYWR